MPDAWHGQQLEDKLLWYLLSNGDGSRFTGTFVDVGAYDGIEFNNTYVFEESGWRGVCVEPHPVYFNRLIRNRKCRCFPTVIGAKDALEVDFYITDQGMLSSAKADYRDEKIGIYGKIPFDGWRPIKVAMMTLDTLIEASDMKEATLVSIDVEGSEREVMLGFTPTKWNVRLIVLEISDEGDVGPIAGYLRDQKYERIGKLSSNYIFSNRERDKFLIDVWNPDR